MKISFESALGPHADALQLRAQRTEVLARNIANADTPGYLARDINFSEVLSSQLDSSANGQGSDRTLKTTHAGHLESLKSHRSDPLSADALMYRMPLMPSFDGNTVDVQTEQAQFAQNNLQFQASLRFLDGKFKGMLSAIKGE